GMLLARPFRRVLVPLRSSACKRASHTGSPVRGDERTVLHVRVQTLIRHGRAMSRPSTSSSITGKTWMPGIKPGIAVQKDGVLSHAYDAGGGHCFTTSARARAS